MRPPFLLWILIFLGEITSLHFNETVENDLLYKANPLLEKHKSVWLILAVVRHYTSSDQLHPRLSNRCVSTPHAVKSQSDVFYVVLLCRTKDALCSWWDWKYETADSVSNWHFSHFSHIHHMFASLSNLISCARVWHWPARIKRINLMCPSFRIVWKKYVEN